MPTKIKIHRLDDAFHFRGSNEAGNTVDMDNSVKEGGTGQGIGPMQMVATALGGCSAIDVVHILKKARQPVENFDIEIEYERARDQIPAVFTHLHVHYILTGDLNTDKVRRAVNLAIRKYCSVATMLEKTATITYSFSVNGIRCDEEV